MVQLHQRPRRPGILKCEQPENPGVLSLKCQIPDFFCRSRAMSYRNALLRKGLKVLSSEGIEGEKAIKMANKALNNHHQSFRQLSRSKGHLLNVFQHPNLNTNFYSQGLISCCMSLLSFKIFSLCDHNFN